MLRIIINIALVQLLHGQKKQKKWTLSFVPKFPRYLVTIATLLMGAVVPYLFWKEYELLKKLGFHFFTGE